MSWSSVPPLLLLLSLGPLLASVPSKPHGSDKSTHPSDKSPSPSSRITSSLHKELVPPLTVEEGGANYTQVYNLTKKGQYAVVKETEYDDLNTFCYSATPASLGLFWASASLRLDLATNDYQVYIGPNISTVVSLAHESGSHWFYSQLPWRSKEFKLSPFENACIGVQTRHEFTINMQWKHVDFLMVLATLAGVFLFFSAPSLCRNTFFHYTTGISLGVLLSVLVLTFLLQKRFKQSIFSWVGLAYSLSVYLMTSAWYNIKEYLTEQYIHWLIGYLVVAGVVSFAAVYRLGPPSNPKTLNLIQWSMQLLAVVLLVMSSYYQEASVALAVLLVTWAVIPARAKSFANTQIQKRFFKPKVKLLTEDEYTTQAHVETQKALQQLKEYCRSPQCKPWQTVSQLRSPTRFAEFIEGSPHLTEAEVMEYSHWEYHTTDDEDEERDIYTDDEDGNPANSDNSEDK